VCVICGFCQNTDPATGTVGLHKDYIAWMDRADLFRCLNEQQQELLLDLCLYIPSSIPCDVDGIP
jgi:hypothetical protein